jgi:hypothetical protein
MRIPTHRTRQALVGAVCTASGGSRSLAGSRRRTRQSGSHSERGGTAHNAPESGAFRKLHALKTCISPSRFFRLASEEAKAVERRFVEPDMAPPIELPVVLGQPKVLRFKEPPLRVYIPDEEVAEFVMLDSQGGRELAINGKKVGSTSLMLWFTDETQAPAARPSSAIC